MNKEEQLLTNHLRQYLTDRRIDLIEKILSQRTRHITVVLENIFQPHNMSAVVRTCECYGVQDLHIVDEGNHYEVNKHVLKGANKWIDIIRYKDKKVNNTNRCLQKLKSEGYKILVTLPAADGIPIDKVPIDSKIALVMGNESDGISEEAKRLADQCVFIPMVGFTESMNISVSAAICLYALLPRLRNSDVRWQLSDEEKQIIRLQWFKKSIRRSDLIEQEFLRSIT